MDIPGLSSAVAAATAARGARWHAARIGAGPTPAVGVDASFAAPDEARVTDG